MEKTVKRDYETPSTRVFKVKQEGVICASIILGLEDYNWNTLVEE